MRLQSIHQGRWQVVAELDDDDGCEVVQALEALSNDPKTASTAAGLYALFEIADGYTHPSGMGEDRFKRLDDNAKIYEFRRRDHRLLCFVADDRLIVCSHVFRKVSQKTRRSEIDKAVRLRERYLAAMKLGRVELF